MKKIYDFLDSYTFAWPLAVMLSILFVILGFVWIDTRGAIEEVMVGTVIDRNYTPPESSTGMGYGMTTNGHMATVITSNSTPENFALFVRDDKTGDVEKITVKPTIFYDKPNGSKLRMNFQRGTISGWRYEKSIY